LSKSKCETKKRKKRKQKGNLLIMLLKRDKRFIPSIVLALLLPLLALSIGATAFLGATPVVQAGSGFVARCGIHFCLDGNPNTPYYFAGANTYDVFTYGDGGSISSTQAIEDNYMSKTRIDAHFAQLQQDKVMVQRLWMFSHETWHGFELQKGTYNEPEFMLFDYVIQSAKAHNVKLIPTFENYWEAYGGIDTRLGWEGLPTGESNRWRFFNKTQCPGCFTSYKNYVSYALNRVNHYSGVAYKNDPTIFAWELMNEPRYENATPDESTTGTTFRAWVDEMGSFIKGIDSNHMLGTGIEGQGSVYGYGGNSGNPFVYVQQSPYIDFTSAHPYTTESWANFTLPQTVNLIKTYISDSHTKVGKPFFMGEFNTRGVDRPTWWSSIYAEMEADGGDGSAFWWYEDQNVDSTYGVMAGAPELTVFRQHSANMQAKNVTTSPTTTPVATTTTPTPTTTTTVATTQPPTTTTVPPTTTTPITPVCTPPATIIQAGQSSMGFNNLGIVDPVPLSLTTPADCNGHTTSTTFTTKITYGAGASNWLAISPTSGIITSTNATTVSVWVPQASIPTVAGTYTATLAFQPGNSYFPNAVVNVTLTIFAKTTTPPTTTTPIVTTTTPTPTTTAVPPTTTVAVGQYSVQYSIASQWNSGYNISVNVINKSGSPVNNWTISWQLAHGETFANYWNAQCSITGSTVTCSNMSYNATLGANGGSQNFGAQFNSTSGVTIPTTFIVNGITVH
jgi:mannan endo-1,4-beta-mannosidase